MTTDWPAAIERYRREYRRFMLYQARNSYTWEERLRRAHARGACIKGCMFPNHPTMERGYEC